MIDLTLTKTKDGDYIDWDGASWDTPAEWLFIGILGGCGCGLSEEFGEEAVKLLTYFATDHFKRDRAIANNRFYELMAHWFDDKQLVEHGTTIMGGWLTEKGKQVYKLIRVDEEGGDEG